MRVFARTQMTGGAMRVAVTLAGHISFDDTYRGAPKGFAAFTMRELEQITDMCGRTIRRALDELAAIFRLTIHRRHHDRHLFRFDDFYEADDQPQGKEEAPKRTVIKRVVAAAQSAHSRVTGHQSPASLYTRTKSNNHTISMIKISGQTSSVHQTPYADIIEDAKKGTDAEKMDTQFLWAGFHLLNTRNGNAAAPLSWLIAFVRKAKPCFDQMKPSREPDDAKPAPSMDPVTLMAKPANRQFNEIDLVRKIGRAAYDNRIVKIQTEYATNQFAAQLAVHGQAVKAGEINP